MFNSAFVGALEGVIEAAGRRLELDCDEIECAAAGARHCRFALRPKP
jgi:predicted hydrocarbon binding protein